MPTIGNVHEVNARDKTVAGMMLDNLARKGTIPKSDYAAIPYNTLYEWEKPKTKEKLGLKLDDGAANTPPRGWSSWVHQDPCCEFLK